MPVIIVTDTPEFKAMWASSMTTLEIADEYGVRASTVRASAARFKYGPRAQFGIKKQGRPWTAKETAQLIRLRRRGESFGRIAEIMDRSTQTIHRKSQKEGLSVAAISAREAPAPKIPKEVPDLSLSGLLRATKGRYNDLAEVAQVHGWSSIQVKQRYHRAQAGERF